MEYDPTLPVRPAPQTVLRRSLAMGGVCAICGLIFGAWVAALAYLTSGYEFFLVAAPLGAFCTGFLFWLLLVARRYTPSKGWAITAGVLTGIVSHWSAWYIMIIIQNLRHIFLGEVSSLGEPPMDPVHAIWGAAVFSFWSLVIFGWITAPLGGALGFALHQRQFRRR